MPKYEVIHAAGRPISSRLKELLREYFKESDLERLERLGGRMLLSMTIPYTNRMRRNRPAITIDDEFANRLSGFKDSPDDLQRLLADLSAGQLRKLAVLVRQPIRSNANSAEIRSEIVKHFQAEGVWRRIADTVVKK